MAASAETQSTEERERERERERARERERESERERVPFVEGIFFSKKGAAGAVDAKRLEYIIWTMAFENVSLTVAFSSVKGEVA